jgi:hypothetical protein
MAFTAKATMLTSVGTHSAWRLSTFLIRPTILLFHQRC